MGDSSYGIAFDGAASWNFDNYFVTTCNIWFRLWFIINADNLKNNFLLLGEAPTLKLWFTKFSINFSKAKAKFCLSLHYNGDNSHLFVNGEEICSLKPTVKMSLFGLIEQVFIELLSLSGSLATKCVSLNNEPCMIRPTLTDLNDLAR